MGNMTLNLWDCGGQDLYYDNYFSRQRERIFSNVGVLIYIFDVVNTNESDYEQYEKCLDALSEFSKQVGTQCSPPPGDLRPPPPPPPRRRADQAVHPRA